MVEDSGELLNREAACHFNFLLSGFLYSSIECFRFCMLNESLRSLNGSNVFNFALSQMDVLADGQCEERVQVDRRRLEQMITGVQIDEAGKWLPNAHEFFDSIEKQSGAQVHWPSRLKIGAKTKKDPFVKVIGEPANVQTAKELISALLKVKKDRVTLKIEISHANHSHIIGRRGKNTQDVMQATQCHIHFPDSNKHMDAEKNNQVSIAGPIAQVERARIRLRQISPIVMTLIATVNENRADVQRLCLNQPDVIVSVNQLSNGQIQWTMKASERNDRAIFSMVERICEGVGLKNNSDHICRSSFDIRSALLNNPHGMYTLNSIRWIAFQTNTQMQFSPQGQSVVILGRPRNILQARRFLMGLLPVSLQFDRVNDQPLDKSIIRELEDEFNVQICEKIKPPSAAYNNDTTFIIRTCEANLSAAYVVRQRLLSEEAMTEVLNEYTFMSEFLAMIKNRDLQLTPLTPLAHSFMNSRASNYSPSNSFRAIRSGGSPETAGRSPDPDESPIAHSLLAGVKSLSMNKGDLWKTPGLERQLSRERMSTKLNPTAQDFADGQDRDITCFEDQQTTPQSIYRFSSSLPADLLRVKSTRDPWTEAGNDGTTSKTTNNWKVETSGTFDSHVNTTTPPTTKVLASVREEEELSDYNQSNSSNTSSPLNRTGRFTSQMQSRKPSFASSANFLDTGLGSEARWDVRTFVDPGMVLAQLNCNEYLPRFREQEIDMQAFLLLDEQNLKDIGVSTMGARKKIYNAIMKLRESALTYGYHI
ncbi:Protein bicaudal C-like protein 1 [Aphelenchoides besseyi]|nr:Protein bicaudal C-like protein 1 [Aphelenchoides besseyi]